MSVLEQLNPEQRTAAECFDGPMMILAGAGTGKTRVITHRIAHMIHSGVDPASIVALSFTNKAAREMSERIRSLAGEAAKKVPMGTFHSFCLQILRTYPEAVGLPKRFGLASPSEQVDLVRRGLDEKGWTGAYRPEPILHKISDAKNKLLAPKELETLGAQGQLPVDLGVLAEAYELYERQLRLNRVIDFDDCIFKTVTLLRNRPDIAAELKGRLRYLLVDEYQDTNLAQLAVLEGLASEEHNVCVVGDDDQSIYSWRGAEFEILEKFENLFPGTRIVKLEQNYRCSNVILGAANELIRNNEHRKEKTLWSDSQETTPIALSAWEDEQAEARYIAEKCIGLLGSGVKPSGIGILYRANAQARPIELALREARITYRTFGGQSFFEKKEVKDFLCYLRVVLNTTDRLALWRIINTPARGIGIKTLEKIDSASQEKRKSPYYVMKNDLAELGAAARGSVVQFVDLIEELAALPRETAEDYRVLGETILRESGLERDVKERTDNTQVRDRKLENLKSLPTWISRVAADLAEEKGQIETGDLIDMMTLDNDRRDQEKGGDHFVSLMTVHAAKGLEFPAVFIAGLEEEQLPHKNSLESPEALCEERRLFYVALTRAKQKLFLSHCRERTSAYKKVERKPSRFLEELPSRYVVRQQDADAGLAPEKREEKRRHGTAATLGKLRESLRQ